MVTRLTLAATLFAALLGAGSPAAAATLRGEVVVSGSQIRLGDLFAGLEPEESLQAVATAPAPGGAVALDPAWIARVAQAYDVDWQPGYRVPAVLVRRASPTEEMAEESAVRLALSRVIAAATVVPAEPEADAIAAAPETEVADELEVPVLLRRVRPGEIIGAGDIDWRPLPESRIDPGVAVDAQELIGMSVRRVLNADQPVRHADLRLPIAVPRGGTVSMVLESPGLRVTARGRALEDGALGQTIRVVNIDSNRTIDAVVIGANAVAIVPPLAF